MDQYEVETEAEFNRAIAGIDRDLPLGWMVCSPLWVDLLPSMTQDVIAEYDVGCTCCRETRVVAKITLKER